MIAEKLVKFYDKPRGRFLCFCGALLVAPILRGLRGQLRRDEELLSEKTMLLGRLELTEKLLRRWWEE